MKTCSINVSILQVFCFRDTRVSIFSRTQKCQYFSELYKSSSKFQILTRMGMQLSAIALAQHARELGITSRTQNPKNCLKKYGDTQLPHYELLHIVSTNLTVQIRRTYTNIVSTTHRNTLPKLELKKCTWSQSHYILLLILYIFCQKPPFPTSKAPVFREFTLSQLGEIHRYRLTRPGYLTYPLSPRDATSTRRRKCYVGATL